MPSKKKKIVCLGGGNAMPRAVLSGLKKYPVKISAICAMLDSGGSTGRLRKDYKIVSPGDIRRAFIALANTSPILESLFNYRFEAGELKGHNFANLFITALELSTNDYEKTFKTINKILNVSHKVLPITLDNSHLYAVLENNKIVNGEANIDNPKHNGNLKIKKVFLRPQAKIYPKAFEEIKKADIVVIGPGDLYSSLAQILLVDGTSQALKETKAKKVYVCNLVNKHGETNNFFVQDFAKEIEKYLKSPLDFIIYNTKKPSNARLLKYKKKHPELIDLVKLDSGRPDNRFIGEDILLNRGSVVHDPDKLAKIILKI